MIDIHRTVRGWAGKRIWNVGYPQLRRKLGASQGYTSNNVSKHPAPTKRWGPLNWRSCCGNLRKGFCAQGATGVSLEASYLR